MGTIPVDSKIVCIGGNKYRIEVWTTTSDLAMGKGGFITANWTLDDGDYLASIPVWIFDDGYLRAFYTAVQQDDSFRKRFKIEAEHPRKDIEQVIIGDVKVEIDREIFVAIKILNEKGFVTKFCCRGNFFAGEAHSEAAYIVAESLPVELIETAKAAGFFAVKTTIRADFSPELQMSANRKFCKLLDDWAHNSIAGQDFYVPQVDESYQNEVRKKFRIPDSVTKGLVGQQLRNFMKIKNPRFGDYAKLRSGRDVYSKMKVEVLAASVSRQSVEEIEVSLNEKREVAAALRWVLRGLAPSQAIRKVQVDLEIGSRRSRK